MSNPTPLLFLDLDGTVRHGLEELGRFVNGPQDVKVFPEAIEMMLRWRVNGGRIVGVSNQGGIALGHVTSELVEAALQETDRRTGRLFDVLVHCPHHPDAVGPEKSRCWCRKPRPGMAIQAAFRLERMTAFSEHYPPELALFVGDREEDRRCAEILNVDFQWARDWRAEAVRS